MNSPSPVLSGTSLTFDNVYQPGTPMLGTSIGAHDNVESCGSLGPFVKVTLGKDEHLCGITCHHVVAPGEPSAVSFLGI